MPECPFDGKNMMCVKRYIEKSTEVWGEYTLVNDFVCPKCGLRVRARYKVVSLGGGQSERF